MAPLASILGMLAQLSLEYIIFVASWFADLPFAALVVPAFPWYMIVLMYGLIGAWLWWYQTKVVTDNASIADELDLSTWEIVDEGEIANGREQSSRPDTQNQKIPIFFR